MSNTEYKRQELLLLARYLDVLKIAFIYGADAVYIGGESMSLRAKAKNFSYEDMKEGVEFAHELGKKVYVAANIFAHNDDLAKAGAFFDEMRELAPDAILISDPGLFLAEREHCPEIPVHISTQANNTNYGTYRFWYAQGVRRVVAARELSLAEIVEIRRNIPEDMEIEAFVHGAMCISYSGRCLLSNFLAGRDANRGACSHPCRWRYYLMEETRPGEYFPVTEDERGTYIFNSKDLCLIESIPEVLGAGITSLKVEGRMKTALYAATCARAYRLAIDTFLRDPEEYAARKGEFATMVRDGTYRTFTTGFAFGRPDESSQIYDSNTYRKESIYLGFSEGTDEAGRVVIHQKNKFAAGDEILVMEPDGRDVPASVLAMHTADGTEVPDAPHPGEELHLTLTVPAGEGRILKKRTADNA